MADEAAEIFNDIVEKLFSCMKFFSVQHCCPTLANAYQHLLDFIALAPRYINDVTVTAIEGLPGVDIRACETIATQRGAKFRKRILNQVG